MTTEQNNSTENQNQEQTEVKEERTELAIDFGETEQEEKVESQETEAQEDSPINQEAVQKRIDKITFQRYEEKQKREEAEKRAQELEERIKSLENSINNVPIKEVPALPDPLDDNFEQALKEREAIIKQNAIEESKLDFQRESKEAQLKKQEEQNQQELVKLVNKVYSDAEKIGMTKDDMLEADRTVSLFVKDPSLSRFILEKGAGTIKALASNIADLEAIGKMDAISAASYITSKVLPKQNSTPETPEPLDIPSGKGATEKVSPFLKGVKLE